MVRGAVSGGRMAAKWLAIGVLAVSWMAVSWMAVSWMAVATAQEAPPHHAQAVVRYVSQRTLPRGVTQAQLSNGVTVLVQENHAAPVATVRCFVKNTGSAYEGRYLGTGVSHMLEHLVALGSNRRRTEPEVQKLVDLMGGQTNAFTSTDLTGYYIDCPAEHAELAIELIADSMLYSLIPENEYVREMGVVQRELEMGEADRNRMMYQAMKSLIYTEHPIRHPTIGYLAVVQDVQRDDVVAYYQNRYVPQNLIFVVVGDVAPQVVLDRVAAHFKDARRTTERGVVLPPEPPQASARAARLEMPGDTTDYSIGWPTVMLQHPDLYALDVASYLLANGDSSRLGYRLKIEQPLAIGVESSSYTPGFVPGWFDVSVQCAPPNLARCQAIIREEIQRLQDELVDDRELAKVKRQKAAEHVFNHETIQEQANSLAYGWISTGDPLFDDRYVDGIQAVTAEQVRDVARRYCVPHRTNEVTIEPVGTASEAPTTLASQTESPVVKKQLANGLTVLLKRHAVNPTVRVLAFVNGGSMYDTDETSGCAAVTSALMERGTEKYDARQIADYFDSIGGSFGMSSQRNTSFLQCSILKDDLAETLDYCFQVWAKPKLDDGEFAKVREQQLAAVSARAGNPQAEIMDYWCSLLPATTPFRRTVAGTLPSLEKLTVADCRRYHQTHFVPNNTVLAVYGDIDVEATWKLLESTFGALPAHDGFRKLGFAADSNAAPGSVSEKESGQPNTSMVAIGFPTVDIFQEQKRAALDVFNAVLTGGSGAGGRLFNELRGARLVYYVFGMELGGPAPGYFLFLAQTRPETRQEVVDRILANVKQIGAEGIPDDELALAKSKLIAAHLQQKVTPGSQAFQAAIDELYGLGHDHDLTYQHRVQSVTNADIRQLIRDHFQQPIIGMTAPK